MVVQMRMIRWTCGYITLNRIRNAMIRWRVKVAPIDDKMRETLLRWFGHVNRRSVNASMRRCETINLMNRRRGKE